METVARKGGLLYPMLVIAAIAVIAFSATGIATMLGWMPPALSRRIRRGWTSISALSKAR